MDMRWPGAKFVHLISTTGYLATASLRSLSLILLDILWVVEGEVRKRVENRFSRIRVVGRVDGVSWFGPAVCARPDPKILAQFIF